MSLMEWNEKLDTGVDEMNDQHKVLLKLMNQLHDSENQCFENRIKILEDLAIKTVTHFKDEEEYMEKIQYPGIRTHKIIHKQLLTKLLEHKESIIKNKEIPNNFFQFLKHWLSAHIVGIDKEYGEYKKESVA